MSDNPFRGLSDDLDADLPRRERELRVVQTDAQKVNPEAAALAARRAEQQGIPFDAAARQEGPETSAFDWGALESESPVLAAALREDPALASAAQDDLENLSWWEKWFGGWRDMAWETKEGWKRGGGDTVRMAPAKSVGGGGDEPVRVEGGLPEHVPGQGTVQLGIIGWMDMNGQATPELLQTAEDIEKEQAANPPTQLGLIPGIPAAAAESLPLMLRGLLDMPERAMEGAALGLPGGPKGAAAGFAVGARLGMAESAGRAEAGLAWLEYKKISNVDPKTAKVAAMMVGIANGTLEMAAFGVILKRFPVLEKVFASGGKATKDIFRKILGDNTKRAAFARLVARFGEAGLVEGSTEFVQELNTIIGGVAAGDETMTVEKALARAWEAGKKGAQGGLGMAGPGVTLNLVQDVQEANNAIRRGQFYTALGEKAAESKLRLRLPKALEQHLDRLQREAGGPVEKMSLPAQVLKKLFQQEGVSDERVARDMPDVAKQLAEAESNPAVEVSIPTAQFAVHVAPLKGFATVQEDIRAGNGMTIREAKVVQGEAKKILEEQKPGKDGEEKTLSPAGKVFNDVLVKLKNAGHNESSARTDAAIWAAVSTSKASRGLAKDAWEYYEKQTLEVGHEELGGAAVTNFTDALGKLRANPPEKVAQDPAALVRMAARRSLGERFSGYRVLSPAESQSVDAGGALAAGRAFLAGADALAEAARTGGRAVGVALTPEDLTEVNEKGEVRVGQLAKERVTAQPVTLGQMSPEATALATARPAPNPATAQVKSTEFSPGMTEHFFTVPGTPFRLTVDEEEDIEGTNRMHVRVLSLKDEKGTPEDQLIEAWKGQGHSTALYLRALMEAQKRGLGFDSDFIRSNATNEMYPRLTRLGVPFELIARPGFGETDDTLYRISAEALAAVDLQAAWEQLVREGVTKAELKLRSLGQKGRGAPGLKKGPTTRGYITFDETRKWFNITETKDRNLSTFLHESGHAFLEMLQRDAESGHAGSQEDLRILREWLGAPVGQSFTDEQLETFARGFEAYLMEGKAPSEELRGVFATVKAWMKIIYQTIQALNAPLSDEVRGVFDRLLASDEAIERARRKSMLVPMFEGDAKVRDMWDRAIAEATGNLEQEAIQTRRRAVKNDLERVQNEVDEEVAADRDYNAWEVLSGRDRPDDATVPPELKGKKLDHEAVRALSLGGQVNRKLQSVSTTEAKDLISLDEAAGFLGYANGLELVKALGALEGRAKHVKAEVTRRMTELYPGYDANAAWLEEQALEELHSGEGVALALLAELEAVGKHVNGKAPPRSVLEAVKLAAQDRAAQLTYLELDPERYRRAEATAGRLAQEAYGSKKLEEAYDAKRQQLWNHFMYREVLKARKEMDRIRDYLAKFDDLATRKKIGLAGQNYLEAIDALLDALDLKRRSMKSLRRAKSLAAYLAEMDAAGEPVAIPADLRDETQLRLKNYKNRTVSDMKAVEAAARNLEHLARMKNKLRLGKDLREFKDLTGGLSAHIEAKAGSKFMEKMGDPQNPGWWEKKRRWLRKSGAYLKKMEFIARALDGGDIAGFAHQTIFQPFANAEKLEVEMKKEIVQRLHDLFDGMTWAERRRYDQEVDFLGTPMRMRDVLAVALNMGNAGNLERLIRGYAYRGWTEENVKARLDELLTNKDVALVEEIWKTIDSLWPHIVKLQEKFVGIAPEKVDPRPVLLPSGRQMSGGYYPIVKDRDRSHLAEKIAERKEGAWENNFMSPVVEHGFTRQRGAEMSPLLLDLSVVPSHLSEVIHYVTHYEAVRAVDRLTQNGEVRAAITNALGKETYLEIRPWLEGIAADGKVLQLSPLDQVLRHLRFGSSIVLYGFKVATGSVQALGMYSTAKDIGAKYAVRGAIRFARELAHGKPWPEDSFEVTNIMLHSDRDVAQLLETGLSAFGTFGQLKADMVHFSMSWMMLVQKTVNSMAYYGAYEKALEDGHPDPVAYAESVVRMTQSAAGVKDLAAIQRSPEAVRMFAVAYSYFSVLFNQLGQPLPPGKRLPELAARWWWLVFLPVITEAWLRNRRPEDGDEPEDWLKFFAAEQFLYVSRTVPFWSAISESFISEKEARTAPWISATLRGAAALGKATLEDRPLSPTDKKALLNLVGTVGHLPSAATVNAARYLEEFSSGSMDEPVRNLLFRSPGQFE